MGTVVAIWLVSTAIFACGSIGLLKGRGALFLGGVMTLGAILWIVAASRLARPDSWWAGRFYAAGQLADAQVRFERDGPTFRHWYVFCAGGVVLVPSVVALAVILV